MSKKRICFIAQFPPPIHGLSKAVEILYNSELSQEFVFEKVDITNNKDFFKNLNLIRKSKADLFYFTISQSKGGNIRDLIILKLLYFQHKRCLIHLHGGYYRQLVDNDMSSWQRKINYKAISQLNGAIVLGETFKPIFNGMIDNDKIYVVQNCVEDQYLMSDEKFKEKVRTIDDRKVKHVLYLSGFIRSKGYTEILEMAKLEKKRVETEGERKLHFDFAGEFFEKSEEEFFNRYVRNNSLENFVTYHGIVGGDEKRELLKECDIFMLLTHYPNEGQPISILEAMGNGMVIVTTDHANIPYIVEDGVNGIIKKMDESIYNLYEKCVKITNSQVIDIINNNRKTVKTKYRQDRYIKNLNDIFKIL